MEKSTTELVFFSFVFASVRFSPCCGFANGFIRPGMNTRKVMFNIRKLAAIPINLFEYLFIFLYEYKMHTSIIGDRIDENEMHHIFICTVVWLKLINRCNTA